jgi:hypothetical protein
MQNLPEKRKAIVALAFRNGRIGDRACRETMLHLQRGARYSRITDAEIKAIMKSAVSRLYALLRLLKDSNPEGYAKEIALGARYIKRWMIQNYSRGPFVLR